MATPILDSQPPNVRAAFHLPPEELEELAKFAAQRRMSTTEVLRSAIAFERFLADLPEGTNVWIESPGGERREIVHDGLPTAAFSRAPRSRRPNRGRHDRREG